ncbi:hypothetical protein BHMPCIPO_02563 [Ensifer sesbaniae]|nr:hypothetical protein [Ensifer sesbaniae]
MPIIRHKTWVFDMFREIGLYLAASPRSRYWQLQQLRELDAERLADIGITAGEAQRGRRNVASAPLPPREEAVALRHAGAARAGAI